MRREYLKTEIAKKNFDILANELGLQVKDVPYDKANIWIDTHKYSLNVSLNFVSDSRLFKRYVFDQIILAAEQEGKRKYQTKLKSLILD